MPKIIENVKQMLLDEARKQIDEKGYSGLTMRSVASACGLAVGTAYNYFESKDMLVATFMVSDWMVCAEKMKAGEMSPAERLEHIYICLLEFGKEHEKLFSDKGAEKSFSSAFFGRHALLRSQLAEIIAPICPQKNGEKDMFLAEFIAEALLSWSGSGKDYSELSPVMMKLLK